MPTQAQPPQPMAAPANPSRPTTRKMSSSNSALRIPTYSSRHAGSPMSFGAAMSGVSFGGGGGGFSYGRGGQGSYGARFYGDANDSPSLPFATSITMDPGSYVASAGAFGLPGMSSSYTRRSYAAAVSGSYDNYNNLSASLASLSTNPRIGSMGHSYSRGQLETLMTLRNEQEHTREYECCGIKHQGLHELLEHVEDQHPYGDSSMHDADFSPVTLAMDLDLEGDTEPPSATHSNRSSTSPRPVPNYPLTPTSSQAPKPEAPASTNPPPETLAPLQLSDVLKSPPTNDASLASINSLAPPSVSSSPTTPTQTTFSTEPKITAASRGAFLSGTHKTGQQRLDRAFNEVVAGNKSADDPATAKPPGPTAVAPSVLFTAAAALGLPSAPPVVGRRDGTVGNGAPVATPSTTTAEDNDKETKEGVAAAPANGVERPKAPEPQLPQPSLFTTHKAWRCPNPGCNKAYKQSNGLKYHLQKGQCDFAIHDAIDHGLTLEEAEERSRPYVCAVGAGCTKRYRQMNGLKYHYLNSGEHGEYGLRMLQNGTHPHPPSLPPPPKRDRSQQQNGRNGAAPYAVPSQMQRPAVTTPGQPAHQVNAGPRMGTWPVQNRPQATTATTTATTNGTNGTNAAAAAVAAPRPAAPPTQSPAPARAAPAPATPATTVPAGGAQAKMAPVQRGRDAVLFSNVDPLNDM